MQKTNRNRLAAIGVMIVVLLTAIVGLFAMSGIKTTQTAYADPVGHTHDEITFTEWTSTNSLPTSAGNYYLTADVTIGGYWSVPSGTTNLCLNGYGIKTTSNRVIYINGGTLNLYDCGDTTHYFNVNNNGQAQEINDEGGDMSFTGGYITGGSGTNSGCNQTSLYWNEGGGILVWSGIFNMYGGTILGNYAGHGGGVEVVNATMNMYGGDIIYNRCGEGGAGINLRSQSNNTATLNMFGGNVCYNKGTAIDMNYCYGNRSFNLSGGSISHNNGTGIWVNAVNISGEPSIEDNSGFGMRVDTSTSFNGKPSISNNGRGDLYVTQNNTITIAKTWENDSMSVVMANKTGVFTSGWSTYMVNTNPADYFTSYSEEYCISLQDGEAVILAAASPHIHDYSDEWSKDDTNHWHACTSGTGTCDAPKKDQAAHTYGDDISAPSYYTCSVCGYEDITRKVPVSYIDETGAEQTCTDYTLINDNTINLTDGWYVVNSEVTSIDRISVHGDVKLIICDGTTLTNNYYVNCWYYDTDSLTIYVQSTDENMGTLVVDNSANDTSFTAIDVSNVSINGGNIIAKGNNGIEATELTINGGNVTAIALNEYSQGLRANNVIITGGKVTATGQFGINGPVTISGGEVSAVGSIQAIYGTVKNAIAGIGWTDVDGTEGKASIAVSTEGQTFDYKKVIFATMETEYDDNQTPKDKWIIDKGDIGVVVGIEGSEEQADITVEVEVKTDVSSEQSQADYSKVAGEKLGNNEKIAFVYDVKLIRTEIIGGVETKTEIQPSDIKAGTIIVVRMDVPTELRGKTFKVLHIHSDEDVEFVEFTKADDGSYITVRTDKLSEFAFITDKDVSSHGFCIGCISFIVTVLSITYLAIYFFLLKKKDENEKDLFAWIGRGFAIAVCVFALVALCVHACVISIISFILAVLLVGAYIALWVLNKNGNSKDVVDNCINGDGDISAQNDIPENDNAEDGGFVMDASGNIFNIRYKKSFLAKLIQSSDETKAYYSELKNEVLAYNKTKSSVSWAYDSVNAGRSQVLKFAIRGKTLCIYFALNPDDYADSKYKVEKAEAAKYDNVPCMYRIKNDRRAKYAIDLIAAVCAKYGLLKGEVPADDYALPYETTDALIKKGLVKELKVVATNDQIQRVKAAGKLEIAEGTLSATVDEDEDEDVLVVDAKGNIFNIRYNKSFKAKLIQSSDEIKAQYSELKNEILSYKKINDRLSWSFDSINSGRSQIAKFTIRGKTLCVYFALNADDYADTKYKVEKVESKKYEAVPCLYRIKNERRLGYAKDLFAIVAEKNGLNKGETPSADYYLPYETTESLINQELIKELKTVATNEQIQRAKSTGKIQYVSQVSVQEAKAMISDEVAATMIEGHIGGAVGKKDIVNVDVLSKNYNDGDTVTIDSLKEKKLVPQSAKQVKLLARGVLDKKLRVELQDYSIEAVKMIIATGGTVKRV